MSDELPQEQRVQLGAAIRAAREARDWSQEELAAKIGRSQSTVVRLESGDLKGGLFYLRAAAVLNLPEASDLGATRISEVQKLPPSTPVVALADLPILGLSDAGGGQMILDNTPIEERARPEKLKNVRGAYGLVVRGESLAPVIRPGHVLQIHPHLPPRRDDLVVLFKTADDGHEYVIVKLLESYSETHWTVTQTNPPKTWKLQRSEWSKVHVVVGIDRT